MKKKPSKCFSSFSLSPPIMAAIANIGYQTATDIQVQTIPQILAGKDVLARADTGSGKTAAFVLPILENLTRQDFTDKHMTNSLRARSNCTQVLVLAPTRELAIQISSVFAQLAQNIQPKLTSLSVYGGVKINPQMMALRSGTDILVATPGRLLDLVAAKAIKFNQVKTLVVDEVDRLMRGDFQDELKQIIKLLPNKRQNLMFTATFPESIRSLVREVLKQPEIINIDQAFEPVMIEHRALTVNHNQKNDLLAHLLKHHDWQQVLIFCSAKRTCDNLVIKLQKREIKAVALHGNKLQSVRSAALAAFKSGQTRILIATDVAARGLDIEQLPCVINYDPPRSPNDYKHRTGRTGRAGQTGVAISLIAHHEFAHFKVIENQNSLRIQREQIEGFAADAIAPPMPKRSQPKKKAGAKNKLKKLKKQTALKQQSEPVKSNPAKSDTAKKTEKKQAGVNAHIWGRL